MIWIGHARSGLAHPRRAGLLARLRRALAHPAQEPLDALYHEHEHAYEYEAYVSANADRHSAP